MKLRFSVFMTTIIVLGLIAYAHAQRVSQGDRCRNYANKTIEQVKERMELEGSVPSNDPVWSKDWKLHYNWCKGGVSKERCEREIKKRQEWLNSHRGSSSRQEKAGNQVHLTKEENTDRMGMNYKKFWLDQADPELCRKACVDDPKCKAYTYVKPGVQGPKARCWLKHAVPPARSNSCCVSGVKKVSTGAGLSVRPPIGGLSGAKDIRKRKDLVRRDHLKGNINALVMNLEKRAARVQRDKFRSQFVRLAKIPPGKVDTERMADLVAGSNEADRQRWIREPRPGKLASIEEIVSFPKPILDKRAVLEESLVFIYGRGFGDGPENGGVWLECHGERTSEFQSAPPPVHRIPLEPYGGSWARAWHHNSIVVSFPRVAEKCNDILDAMITVKRGGKHPVVLHSPIQFETAPGMKVWDIETLPENSRSELRAVPRGEIFIRGVNFGAKPGKVKLLLWPHLSGLSELDLLPADSNWWCDYCIHVKVPNINMDLKNTAKAKLEITTSRDKIQTLQNITFGPRLYMRFVSAHDYLSVDDQGEDYSVLVSVDEKKQDTGLMITHSPGCGALDHKGETGHDKFFYGSKSFLPPDSELLMTVFLPFDPGGRYDGNYAWDLFQDNFEQCLGGPWECAKAAGETFLGGFVELGSSLDPQAGSYVSKVVKKPTATNPTMIIEYQNSCTGNYSGIDNRYVVSFLFEAPEWVFKGPLLADIDQTKAKYDWMQECCPSGNAAECPCLWW